MNRIFIIILTVTLLMVPKVTEAGSIIDSKHNLSVSGSGTVKAQTEQQVCIFCHTPHGANPAVPLWNHQLSVDSYIMYNSGTMDAGMPQGPGEISLLCLSCHDGTIAVGAVGTGLITMEGTTSDGKMPAGFSNLGTNLGDDHPVNIPLTLSDAQLVLPAPLDPVHLDESNLVQCTSCHNVHDDQYHPFLVKADQPTGSEYGGALCFSCHNMFGWDGSAHQRAAEVVLPEGETVAGRACRSCHTVHGSQSYGVRLICNEEEACFTCHDGNVAQNISTVLGYLSAHPVNLEGMHNPRETWEYDTPRHAECWDCHNGHASGNPSYLVPTLAELWGVEPAYSGTWSDAVSFQAISEVTREYQLCFKCHSSRAYGLNPPVSSSRERQFTSYPQTNVVRDFNYNNQSLHAVFQTHPRFSDGVDGLINGWSWSSILRCSDCHGSGESLDPKGPHGSQNGFILRGPWEYGSSAPVLTGASGTQNHLCFNCHSYDVYVNGSAGSNFNRFSMGANLHGRHGAFGCSSCHSAVPHGWNKPAMIVEDQDSPPYNQSSNTLTVNVWSFGSWSKSDCSTSCHHGP